MIVELDRNLSRKEGDTTSVHDIVDRGLPGGIVESCVACDQEAEAEDCPRAKKLSATEASASQVLSP
ncbi:hypothetical protein CIT26_09940 [Mesorhizobium temperatum]|uniref:Uncharacterized protein n=1 Tax=Mesorhizobium temperatum TaxID=241416 RepID=A0A271LPE2_9HYPH|nr:hypothetical protein CIT26_09940 [Mesorhizobium temperatum]